MASLKQALDEIASRFAAEILAALSGASMGELQQAIPNGSQVRSRAPKAQATGRPSASGHALEQVAANVVAYLKEHGPTRSEDLRKALRIPREDMSKALALAAAWKAITKTGEKRATTYKALKTRGPKPQLTLGDRMRVAAVGGR